MTVTDLRALAREEAETLYRIRECPEPDCAVCLFGVAMIEAAILRGMRAVAVNLRDGECFYCRLSVPFEGNPPNGTSSWFHVGRSPELIDEVREWCKASRINLVLAEMDAPTEEKP